jgi:3-hydroxy-D-aspartate aldolase
MDAINQFYGLEVGYDVPALPGMSENDIQTPCLVLDLDALERNIIKMGERASAMGVRLRAHGKMHKSVDVAKLQQRLGGSVGVCCQKVSEAEAFVRGGITDVLVSNQVRDMVKIDRLARLPKLGARTACCVDDPANIADLSDAASRHGTRIDCLVDIDCGAGRCGVTAPADVVALAKAINAAPGLSFAGIQAYQGAMQHLVSHLDRKAKADIVIALVRQVLGALKAEGIACGTVTGGGTGSYQFEGQSGLFTELQCGSYAFMDAAYGRVLDQDGNRIDATGFENALFILTSVMSHVKADKAVCDAGLKVLSLDSGLPVVFGRNDVTYTQCSDEHGEINDPDGVLKINDKIKLVPGHCDPTCNLHDWYVGVRDGKVESLWPVSARGKTY